MNIKYHSRVSRGDSWYGVPIYQRVSDRDGFKPDYRCCNFGFRLVCLK